MRNWGEREACNIQIGHVLEDKSRLTHLMSIAQNLRLPSSRSDTSSYSHNSAPYEASRLSSAGGFESKHSSLSGGALPLGGGILRVLALNTDSASGVKDTNDESLHSATSSIPRCASFCFSARVSNGVDCPHRFVSFVTVCSECYMSAMCAVLLHQL